jgi:hypothetical protein
VLDKVLAQIPRPARRPAIWALLFAYSV